MPSLADTLSRTEKVLIDREDLLPEEARQRLAIPIRLVCGPEVADSPTLQAAVLTAANTAKRCFRGPVDLVGSAADTAPMLVNWPCGHALAGAVEDMLAECKTRLVADGSRPLSIVFGTAECESRGLQVTFNGWSGGVVPIGADRLHEHGACPIAGVIAGALAVSELFNCATDLCIEATRRSVGVNLWDLSRPWYEAETQGPLVEYAPAEFHLLGIGHLGQAYLWTIGMLPFADPLEVTLVLQDHDRVVPGNWDTGLLTTQDDIGRLKTRIAEGWLEARGFQVRRVDRRFDAHHWRHHDDPRLVLCGFDGNGPRHLLDERFPHVLECGLGGEAETFNCLAFHNLPFLGESSATLWPQPQEPAASRQNRAESLAAQRRHYRAIREEHSCGHVEVAGVSVAAPFVGAAAAALVIAEALRMAHGGPCFGSAAWRLASPQSLAACPAGHYGKSQPRLRYAQLSLRSEGRNRLRGSLRQ